MYTGSNFVNIQNKKVLDVHANRDEEGRKVIVWKRHNGANQRWKVVYKDQAGKDATKGMNKDFGFFINRPFYFRSRLPMKRIAEAVGTNMKLKRYNSGRLRQQTFIFDEVSKTIKS
jgi:hypothetical protein